MSKSYKQFDHPVRSAVYKAMESWPIDHWTLGRAALLAECLGFKDMHAMVHEMTDRHAAICRMLAGPHGYIIYKAMLARQDK